VRIVDAEAVAALGWPTAIDRIRAAVVSDSGTGAPPRTVIDVRAGQLLLMPAAFDRYAGVKVVSIAPDNPRHGLPRVQGAYLLFDATTLDIAAVIDGVALTTLRTAAVSALAVDRLARPGEARLVVFGCGPQARGHIQALSHVRPIRHVTIVGRRDGPAEALARHCTSNGVRAAVGRPDAVAEADIVVCATTARTPVFDSTTLPAHAVVVAIGSHEPDAREVDSALVERATVVVESRAAALREAGDILLAIADGMPSEQAIDGDLAELVGGDLTVRADRPRLWKSVGEAWEDLAVAAAVYESTSR
jgi:ornithine cyclodeaminase/alanine dehydrogenase-like protein (mu-crystallin family)